MLSSRPTPVRRLRVASVGHPAPSFPRCCPATVGRCGVLRVRHATTTITAASVSLPSAGGPRGGTAHLFCRAESDRPYRHLSNPLHQIQARGKKRTVVSLDDLPQGLIVPLEPLPPPQQEQNDDEPAYPTVVQQARRNMQKFNSCVLLTRVGGFYELYFEHADEYGPLLNIKVSQKRTSAGPVSMAGFPFFQLDRYLKILVQDLSRHVAIAEEFPHNASEKIKSGGLMHDRRVARIVTPGTLIDENFMDPYANNYVMAIHLPETSRSAHEERQERQQPGDTPGPANDAPTRIGLAWLDLSTGYFFTQPTTLVSLGSVLSRVSPREIVLDQALGSSEDNAITSILQEEGHLVSYSPQGELKALTDWAPMLESKVPAREAKLFTESEVEAGNLLLHYVRDRLQGLSMKLQPPVRYLNMDVMSIDRNTMRSLEIKETAKDGMFKGTLLHAIRRTATKSGARLLNQWLSFPSTSLEVINHRQELVALFIQNEDLRDNIIALLHKSHDSQRLVQKFALNRGEPDDLLQLAGTIQATQEIVKLIQEHISSRSTDTPQKEPGELEAEEEEEGQEKDCLTLMLDRISLEKPLKVAQSIRNAIDEEGLVQQHELEDSQAGEMMALAQEIVKAEGTEADALSALPKRGAALPTPTATTATSRKKAPSLRDFYGVDNEVWIMKPRASRLLSSLHSKLKLLKEDRETLNDTLRARFSAPSLTLRWSPGLGHICHVKGKDAREVPTTTTSTDGSPSPVRTLSTSRSTRTFHLPEWTHLGESLDRLRLQIRAEEQRVFAALRAAVVVNLIKLRRNASVLDELDIVTSFARLALENHLVRPVLNNSTNTVIMGGRHPTVEGGLAEQGRMFQKNDLLLGGPGPGSGSLFDAATITKDESAEHTQQPTAATTQGRVWLITGPNMGGKSTFLRQNALIAILAQVGCYVPADYAELGIIDAIFSRVGSADNLYQDQSTFMVEMLETAAILRQATPRSFVIMDEVGRGTTPEDGEAVAFAGLHHLIKVNKCRALFATHFHGIADLVAEHGLRVGDEGPDGAVEMYCTDVEEDPDSGFVYVHKLRKGINRNSHALKVARLAGLPEQAIRIAQQVLEQAGRKTSEPRSQVEQETRI